MDNILILTTFQCYKQHLIKWGSALPFLISFEKLLYWKYLLDKQSVNLRTKPLKHYDCYVIDQGSTKYYNVIN